MKVYVLDHTSAEKFVPDIPTLAIRIFDSFAPNNGELPLTSNKLWVRQLGYTFDDIELDRYSPEYLSEQMPGWQKKYKLFNENLAQQLVNDFSAFLDVPQIVMHCAFGWKRSPAVARGLEHIFDLDITWGNERTHKIMSSSYDGIPYCGNTHVYKLLCQQKDR